MATRDQDESPIPPEPPDAEAEKAALRQQISSLKLRLAQAEAELATTRSGGVGASTRGGPAAGCYLLARLYSARPRLPGSLAPEPADAELFRDLVVPGRPALPVGYPSYFLIIFPCLLLCVPLVWRPDPQAA